MKTILISLPDHVARTVSDRALARRMPVEDLAVQLIGAALGHSRTALSDPGIVKFHVRFRPGPGRAGPFPWNAKLGVVAFLMGSTDEMAFAVVYGDGHFGTVAARDCVLDDGDEDAEAPDTPGPATAFVDETPAFPPLPVRKALPRQPAVKHDASATEILLAYIDGQKVGQFVPGALSELIRVVQEALRRPLSLDVLMSEVVGGVIDALRQANLEVQR